MREENPRAGAVENVDSGHAHPGTQIINGKRDVLSVGLVEHPDFARGGGAGDPVAVVVEEEAVGLGVATEGGTEFFYVFHGGVEGLLVFGPGLPAFVLLLEVVADCFDGLAFAGGPRVEPAFDAGTGGDFHDVRGVSTNVEAQDQGNTHGFHPLFKAPGDGNVLVGGPDGSEGLPVAFFVEVLGCLLRGLLSFEHRVALNRQLLRRDGGRHGW